MCYQEWHLTDLEKTDCFSLHGRIYIDPLINGFLFKVETLLSSFLKDVGISEEQFMNACKEGSGSPQFSGMNRVSYNHIAGVTLLLKFEGWGCSHKLCKRQRDAIYWKLFKVHLTPKYFLH